MRKIITIFCLVVFGVLCLVNHSMPANAAKKAKKNKVDEAAVTKMNENVDLLTRKYYTRELYSPADSDMLINLKLQLDNLMDTAAEPVYAPIYYKLGNLFKLRGMKNEAISCHKTILENFSDTAYSPKSIEALKAMGVEIELPESNIAGDEEDY